MESISAGNLFDKAVYQRTRRKLQYQAKTCEDDGKIIDLADHGKRNQSKRIDDIKHHDNWDELNVEGDSPVKHQTFKERQLLAVLQA